MTDFPIIDTPVNKTTALVLQTYKPSNDYDEIIDRLHQTEATLKALKDKPKPWNKRHKQRIKEVGVRIHDIHQEIIRIKTLLGRTRGQPLDLQCFIEACRENMNPFEFKRYLSLAREKMKKIEMQNDL